MTTQLWGWKYNGQDEVGPCSSSFGNSLWNMNGGWRKTSEVTDLHKVKVVDADAVVLNKKDFERVIWGLVKQGNNYKQIFFPVEIADSIWNQLTPPVTEPKGFGAVVDAGFNTSPEKFRKRWVSTPTWQGTLIWHSEDCAMQPWENLINPIVISEGQK